MKLILLIATLLLCETKIIAQGVDSTMVIALVYTPSQYPISIRSKPNIDADPVGHCNSVDSVRLIRYDGGKYYYVSVVSKPSVEGYLYVDFLKFDAKAVEIINDFNERKGKSFRIIYTKPPSGYKDQKTQEIPTSTSTTPSSFTSSPSSTYHSIQTGPRGGKYYINKNGNKTYVKRKK